MPFTKSSDRRRKPGGTNEAINLAKNRYKGVFVCFLALTALVGAAPPGQHATSGDPNKSLILPEANRPPDMNEQMKMREQQAKQQNYAAANAERLKQIAEDSTLLLKLATELKAEVDKTTKDMLSVSVIRKADEIERLAHNMKEKMKLTAGGN
jgi:hypothetical protein